MTREEAIRCLEICKKYIDKIRASEGVEVSKELCMALDMAIKSLEQESTDNVLNKITGELKSAKKKWWYGVDDDCFMKLLDVLDIIDKYKTESEAAEQ